MKIKIIFSLIVLSILSSCTPAMQQIYTKENYKGNNFNNILVLTIGANREVSTTFENSIVRELKKKGIKASNSSSIMKGNEELDVQQIEASIKKGNYDGILISSLVDVKTKKISITGPTGYQSKVSNYSNYINDGLNFRYTDDDFIEEKMYILESTLFDTSVVEGKETMVWKGQSSITDPSSLYSGSKEHAKNLVKTLVYSTLLR